MPSVIENSIGMKLVYVPPGKFRMGSPATDRERNNIDEVPQHEVEITKGFHLGQHEVTVGEFKAFVASEKYLTEAEKDGKGGGIDTLGDSVVDAKYTWRYPVFAATDQHPVANVSWNDAKAFCAWLSRKEGINYRLPSEAEWEYACRGGTETVYQGGDDPESLSTYGNIADGTLRMKFPSWRFPTIRGKDGYVFAAPVGQFRKNDFGLNDMHGNVAEWCEDRYDENYYKVSPSRDPTGPEIGQMRLLRGGSWKRDARFSRSASRQPSEPASRTAGIGFRIALSAKSANSPPRADAPLPGPAKAAPKAGTEIENSIGMKLVYIPAGKFMMGSPTTEPGRLGDEGPQHEVEITKGFYCGKYAVTQAEYQTVMGTNPSWFAATGTGSAKVTGLDTSRFPVEWVSWHDAKEFCRKLSAKEGTEYWLPTEAEWEYACRAGTTTAYHRGTTLSAQDANFDKSKDKKNKDRPVVVGSYATNAWGLCDMHGNVWQWCEDRHRQDYYANSPRRDPMGPGPESGSARVIRGGCWSNSATDCRAAARLAFGPSTPNEGVGFRIVLGFVK